MLQNRSRSQTVPQEAEDTNNLLLEENDYNPFASPPDVAKALKHQKAQKIGEINLNKKKTEICECCKMPTNSRPFSVCGAQKNLSCLGVGFPLYFQYVLYCGVLLILLFALVGLPAMSTNMKGTACQSYKNAAKYPCKGGFLMDYSLGNVHSPDNYGLVSGLSLVFVIVCMVFVTKFKKLQDKTIVELDEDIVACSDYTVMVSDIPKTENAEKIKAYFEANGRNGTRSDVKCVNLAYEVGTYIALTRKKASLAEKIAKGKANEHDKKYMKILEEKIKEFDNAGEKNPVTKFAGIAFITFNTEDEAYEVTQKFEITGLEKFIYKIACCFGCGEDKKYLGKFITVKEAPDAQDVFWENLGHDWWETFKMRMLTLLSSLVLIGASFGTILGISLWQNSVSKNSENNSSLITFLAFLSSYLVTIINTLMGTFLRRLSGLERHTTWTYYFMSVGKKLTFAQFINTALLNTIVQILRGTSNHLWLEDSIVSKVFFLFLLNAFIPSVSYIFNPMFLLRLYKRRQLVLNTEKSKMTQQQANLLFEGPPLDPAQRYANIQKTLLFTGFYATLVPIGIVFSVAGLIIAYWTDKYLLLNRHSRPRVLGKELAEDMTNFMYLFIVAFASGTFVFELIARGNVTPFSYVALIFAGLFYLFPYQYCLKVWTKTKKYFPNRKTYNQVKDGFLTDYSRSNPMTEDDANRAWMIDFYRDKDPATIPENIAAYLRQIPKHNPLSNLANYAQNNPSLRQMHRMNGHSNFNMSFIPRQQPMMMLPPVFMNQSMPLPMQMMNPGSPMRFIPQQLFALYPRLMPNLVVPVSPLPQMNTTQFSTQSPLQVSIDIPQNKPDLTRQFSEAESPLLPVRQSTHLNQSLPTSQNPILLESQQVPIRTQNHIPPQIQPQPQPQPQPYQMNMNMSMNPQMIPINPAPAMQYPGMMPPNNIPMMQQVQMPFGGQPQGPYGFAQSPPPQFGMQYNMAQPQPQPQYAMQQPMMPPVQPMQYPMSGQPGFGQYNQRF